MRMKLDSLFKENEEALTALKLKDSQGWVDTYHWKLTKSLESLFNIEKLLGRMVQALPKAKKTKTEHIIHMTKKDLLITLLNMISSRLESVIMDEEVDINVLLELQEVLGKLSEKD